MLRRGIADLKTSFQLFSANRAASHGAAIAFYAVTSIAPVLLIVIAVAGLVFGQQAASGALFAQFRSALGPQASAFLQRSISSASGNSANIAATVISVVTLIATASGVFIELEDGMNAMWQAKQEGGLKQMALARITSLGLVIGLGILLLVSLVIDAALRGVSALVDRFFAFANVVLLAADFVVILGLMTLLFGLIFRFIPARRLPWRDCFAGGLVTAILFEAGKFLLGMYLGSNSAQSSLGAAGALLGIFYWAYYSAQIFLFGAAYTWAHSEHSAEQRARPG